MIETAYFADNSELVVAVGVWPAGHRQVKIVHVKPDGARPTKTTFLGGRIYMLERLAVNADHTMMTITVWGDDGGIDPPIEPNASKRWVPYRRRAVIDDNGTVKFPGDWQRCFPDAAAYCYPTIVPGVVDSV